MLKRLPYLSEHFELAEGYLLLPAIVWNTGQVKWIEGKRGKQVEKRYGVSWVKSLLRFAVSLKAVWKLFQTAFFRAALTGIAQTLRYAVDG